MNHLKQTKYVHAIWLKTKIHWDEETLHVLITGIINMFLFLFEGHFTTLNEALNIK
jgi:hypothetical protein